MFGFGGGKALEQQKAALRECTELLVSLEESIAGLALVKSKFVEVWPESDIQELRAKTDKMRQLVDLLTYRTSSAKRELANFDSAIDLMRRQLPLLHRDRKACSGLMVARGSIASGELSIKLDSNPPSVFDCQRALVELAEELRDDIRVNIDELAAIKPTFNGPWPAALDLGKYDVRLRDVSDALAMYRERLRSEQRELAVDSTATLWEMIERMQLSISAIEEQRSQLAMHSLMHHVMSNREKGQALP